MSAPEKKHATRPDEGDEWELPWLRGYEAGVIDMRAERDALAARVEAARDSWQLFKDALCFSDQAAAINRLNAALSKEG